MAWTTKSYFQSSFLNANRRSHVTFIKKKNSGNQPTGRVRGKRTSLGMNTHFLNTFIMHLIELMSVNLLKLQQRCVKLLNLCRI